MKKYELPVPVYRLALLQAYLYEIFTTEKRCEQNFKYTDWYLTQNFSGKDIEKIFQLFKDKDIKCDCDVIKKLGLHELSKGTLNFHE